MTKKYLPGCEPEAFEKLFIENNEEIYDYWKSTHVDDDDNMETHSLIKTSSECEGDKLDEFYSYKFDYYRNEEGFIVYVTKYDFEDQEIWSKKIEM